jgi:hypothetical protein
MFVLEQGLFQAGNVSRRSFAKDEIFLSQACGGSLLMADHREQRSDAAIQESWALYVPPDCFASLAMTSAIRRKCTSRQKAVRPRAKAHLRS